MARVVRTTRRVVSVPARRVTITRTVRVTTRVTRK